jgi:hypothetical protein
LLGGGGGRGRGGRGGFGIRSQGVHPSSEVHGKGYKRSQFEDAWARYLPAQSLPSPPEGGSIDRANVQTRMDKGQLAQNRPCRPCTFARSILWPLSYSRRGLHVCTVY